MATSAIQITPQTSGSGGAFGKAANGPDTDQLHEMVGTTKATMANMYVQKYLVYHTIYALISLLGPVEASNSAPSMSSRRRSPLCRLPW